MRPDLLQALALSEELHAVLADVPGRYQDPEGHAAGVMRIRNAVWALDEQSIIEDGRLRAFGIQSTSTGGILCTVRNWITRVHMLAEAQAKGAA